MTILPDKRTIVGYTTKNSGGVPDNFKNYFVLRFDHDFVYKGCLSDGKLIDNQLSARCNHAMAVVGFQTKKGEQVNVQVASSFISEEQAFRNLKEVEGKSFEQVKAEGKAEWNKVLGRIEVEDDNVDHLRTFYSCLYRSVLSLVPSMSLIPTESPFIIVLIMGKYSKDTSLQILDTGILSVHCSPCLTLSTLL